MGTSFYQPFTAKSFRGLEAALPLGRFRVPGGGCLRGSGDPHLYLSAVAGGGCGEGLGIDTQTSQELVHRFLAALFSHLSLAHHDGELENQIVAVVLRHFFLAWIIRISAVVFFRCSALHFHRLVNGCIRISVYWTRNVRW